MVNIILLVVSMGIAMGTFVAALGARGTDTRDARERLGEHWREDDSVRRTVDRLSFRSIAWLYGVGFDLSVAVLVLAIWGPSSSMEVAIVFFLLILCACLIGYFRSLAALHRAVISAARDHADRAGA